MQPYFNAPYDWRPAATSEQLEAAAQALEITWPDALRSLYEEHDGAGPQRLASDWEEQWEGVLDEDEDARPQAPFLMSLEEAAAWYVSTAELFPADLRFFWTDDNSNYVGVYVRGPLEGMVCVLGHDGGGLVPVFRTIPSFLDWVDAHPLRDVFTDGALVPAFPGRAPDPLHDEEDWQRALSLYQNAEQREDNPRLACAMALTPYGQSSVLLPFLDHPDFYVVARAVEILAQRRYTPAYTLIRELAVQPGNRSNGAAERAMRTWRP
ncbi:hypothetical protein GO986_21235 [Deinococcus sp. HMF7620]|uniref:Knr4/Smi1-like domain-containing protein n=1 Tax=Deinococcus arboris TaxID=2682977 RepID=A0A7C9MBN7_9DEIO|nr:hypothetical protein [Deinococcus arboris]